MTDEPTEELRGAARADPAADDEVTEQFAGPIGATPMAAGATPSPGYGRGLVAGFAGTVGVAIVVLALGVLVAMVVSRTRGVPGPTVPAVVAHVVGAVLAVPLYRMVSRRGRPVRWLAAVALAADLVVLLWVFWWAT